MDIKIGDKIISIDDQKVKDSLEKGAGLTVDSDLIIKTKEEQDQYINNLKPSIINTAMEMKVKELRDSQGLELEAGKKSFDGLFEALGAKLKNEYTKEPNEQLKSKDSDIELLKGQIVNLTENNKLVSSQFKEFKNTELINKTISKHIPSNSLLDAEDMLMIIKNKVKPSVSESGKVVFSKDGDIMKDPATLTPFGANKVMESFFSEHTGYLKGTQGGAGGGDSTGKHKEKSIESFNEKFKTIGQIGSVEYNLALNDAVTKGEVEV